MNSIVVRAIGPGACPVERFFGAVHLQFGLLPVHVPKLRHYKVDTRSTVQLKLNAHAFSEDFPDLLERGSSEVFKLRSSPSTCDHVSTIVTILQQPA